MLKKWIFDKKIKRIFTRQTKKKMKQTVCEKKKLKKKVCLNFLFVFVYFLVYQILFSHIEMKNNQTDK
jgi:hypothetical protein